MTQAGSFVAGNSVNNHFKGRIAWLKHSQTLLDSNASITYVMEDDCNFPHDYTDVMTAPGEVNTIGSYAEDGLLANGLGFTQSDGHTGDNMYGWSNIDTLLATNMFVTYQAQPVTYW